MALQFVIRAQHVEDIERELGQVFGECEVFPIRSGHFGLSIPQRTVEAVGEPNLRAALAALSHFDLWAGAWNQLPPPVEAANAPSPAKGGFIARLFGRGGS